ncbi:hypothetical protein SCUP234_07941 [Seiridium cupressi]
MTDHDGGKGGLERLPAELKQHIFKSLDFASVPALALVNKTFFQIFKDSENLIAYAVIENAIGSVNMSIAVARYVATQLTWTPTLEDGMRCSVERFHTELENFGQKYLTSGATTSPIPPCEFGFLMASEMISFHQHVCAWTEAYLELHTGYKAYLTNGTERKTEHAVYIIEIMRLLLPPNIPETEGMNVLDIFDSVCIHFARYLPEDTDGFPRWDPFIPTPACSALLSKFGVKGLNCHRYESGDWFRAELDRMLEQEPREFRDWHEFFHDCSCWLVDERALLESIRMLTVARQTLDSSS